MPIAGGILFGFWPGFFYSVFSLAAGSSLGFFIARRWGTLLVKKIWKGRPAPAFSKKPGFLLLVVVRLTGIPPIMPANVLAGLSEMPYSTFLAGTVVGYLPWCTLTNLFSNILWAAYLKGGMDGIKHTLAEHLWMIFAVFAFFGLLVAAATWAGRRWVRQDGEVH